MDNKLKRAAQDALDVQNACNLSGVVHAFSRAMAVIRENTNGTAEANHHPIAVLFADKIASLTGSQMGNEYGKAYAACVKIVKDGGKKEDPMDAEYHCQASIEDNIL